MSRMPWDSNLGPLKMVKSKKSMDCVDDSFVNLIELTLPLRWARSSVRQSSMSSSSSSMLSMYLSQTIGWVPGQALRASNSTLPMKRLARVGATGVPMATPLICLKFFLANSNVLCLMTWSSISLSMFLSGWLVDVGGSVGSACWRAKLTPNAWGIDGYSDLEWREAVGFCCRLGR